MKQDLWREAAELVEYFGSLGLAPASATDFDGSRKITCEVQLGFIQLRTVRMDVHGVRSSSYAVDM